MPCVLAHLPEATREESSHHRDFTLSAIQKIQAIKPQMFCADLIKMGTFKRHRILQSWAGSHMVRRIHCFSVNDTTVRGIWKATEYALFKEVVPPPKTSSIKITHPFFSGHVRHHCKLLSAPKSSFKTLLKALPPISLHCHIIS